MGVANLRNFYDAVARMQHSEIRGRAQFEVPPSIALRHIEATVLRLRY